MILTVTPLSNARVRIAAGEAFFPEQLRNDGAKPLAGRVVRISLVPMLHHIVGREGEREGQKLDSPGARNQSPELFGNNSQTIGTSDHACYSEATRQAQADLALDSIGLQCFLDDLDPAAGHGKHHMGFLLELLQAQGVLDS